MKFEYYKSKHDNQWYFRIVGKNGETVAQSEGVHNEKDCLSTISAIKRGTLLAEVTWVEAP